MRIRRRGLALRFDGGCRRWPRRRSDAEKRRIVAESYDPGVTVQVVARHNGVGANPVLDRRRELREQDGDAGNGACVPVVVEPAGEALSDDAASGIPPEGRIEIGPVSGCSLTGQ